MSSKSTGQLYLNKHGKRVHIGGGIEVPPKTAATSLKPNFNNPALG